MNRVSGIIDVIMRVRVSKGNLGALIGGLVGSITFVTGYLIKSPASFSLGLLALILGLAIIFALLCSTIFYFIFKVLRCIPPKMPIAIAGIIIATVFFAWVVGIHLVIAIVFCTLFVLVLSILGVILMKVIYMIKNKSYQNRKLFSAFLIILSLIQISIIYWALYNGTDHHMVSLQHSEYNLTDIPDPTLAGEYEVDYITYGSGTDKYRTHFAHEAHIITDTVDLSSLIPEMPKWRSKQRTSYWGFNMDRVPLNGHVWIPKGEGPFPLVLIVHGNSPMERFSDEGYEYLGRHLASKGYITVSIDQNFLNMSNIAGDYGGKEIGARALSLIHI